MLRIKQPLFQNCSGITRRNLLQIGAPLMGLGLAGLASLRRRQA